jgi:hypothetical protein
VAVRIAGGACACLRGLAAGYRMTIEP